MSTVTITDVPQSLIKRIGKHFSFAQIQGLYRDGMDWVQYDEVIPSEGDIEKFHKTFDKIDDDNFISLDQLKKNLGNTK